ncbi:type II toxin-antitoxin system VapC family toxin [Nocardia speluncae]|uniref:Ribonuclease VapC n=1 Tax=Nocardia speluncae TaxID=419477 RepID=A0A846XFS7_9NOCA|nr:type II toxin-antitoxin system VapC family toxin [Nocardia speluncae]NKY33546.1 type II toxin-antitoxin system VapC family toxin [Nocardia speluncae]
MGTLIDTSVFIDLERAFTRSGAATLDELADRLAQQIGVDEEVAMAAVTASELLHGVHRASPQQRPRREAFVEMVIAAFPPQPFDLLAARVHAGIWADLTNRGQEIGAHDVQIAATALSIGWQVATANVRHFERIPGLGIRAVRLRD